MADNYLEQAMEDMRNGRLKARYAFSMTGRPRFVKHVYIKDIQAYGIDNVRELVRNGVKVSFSYPDGHVGSRLARTLKCNYRPTSMGKPADAEEL